MTFRERETQAVSLQGAEGANAPVWCTGGGIPISELLILVIEERLRLVLRSMLLYYQWYDLARKIPVPAQLVADAATC